MALIFSCPFFALFIAKKKELNFIFFCFISKNNFVNNQNLTSGGSIVLSCTATTYSIKISYTGHTGSLSLANSKIGLIVICQRAKPLLPSSQNRDQCGAHRSLGPNGRFNLSGFCKL